jgi:hypothetical protein
MIQPMDIPLPAEFVKPRGYRFTKTKPLLLKSGIPYEDLNKDIPALLAEMDKHYVKKEGDVTRIYAHQEDPGTIASYAAKSTTLHVEKKVKFHGNHQTSPIPMKSLQTITSIFDQTQQILDQAMFNESHPLRTHIPTEVPEDKKQRVHGLISEMTLASYNTVIQNYFLLAFNIRYYMMYGPYPEHGRIAMDKISMGLIKKLMAIIDTTTQYDAVKQCQEIKSRFKVELAKMRMDLKVIHAYMAELRQTGKMHHYSRVVDEVWKIMAVNSEFKHYMAVLKNVAYLSATEHMTFTTIPKAFGEFKDASKEELTIIGPIEQVQQPENKIMVYVGASTQNDGTILQLDRSNIKRSKIYAYDQRYDDKYYSYKASLKNNGFQYSLKKNGNTYDVMARYPQAPQIYINMSGNFDFDINVELYKNQGEYGLKVIAARQYGMQYYNFPENEQVLNGIKLQFEIRSIIEFKDTMPDGYIVRGYQFSGKAAEKPFYVKKKHSVDVFVDSQGLVGRFQYDVADKTFKEDKQASQLMRQHVLYKDQQYITTLTENANYLINKAHDEHQYRICTKGAIIQLCENMHADQFPQVQPCNNICTRYQWHDGIPQLLTTQAIYGKRDFVLEKYTPEQVNKIAYVSKVNMN